MPIQSALRSPTTRLLVAGGVLVVVIGVIFKTTDAGDGRTTFGDITQLVLSAVAATASAIAAVRSRDGLRRTWTAIAIGVGGWAVGQAIWSYYELISGDDPFPSPADAGFLLFPVGVAVALWLLPTYQPPGIRFRNLLDGVVIVSSLLAISWALVMQSVVENADKSHAFGLIVSVAYPVGDVLFIGMMVYGLSRPGPYRRTQILLAVALTAMAASDGPFAYQSANDLYETGSLIDIGWVIAFVVITVAAITGADKQLPPPAPSTADEDAPILLPYVPLVLAGAVVVWVQASPHAPRILVEGICLAVAVVAVLGRQYLTVLDNRRLVKLIEAREEQLRKQATMDLLTGLTNRALFNDRVSHALELHRRDMRPLAIMFCDLDDFKVVNDTFGHGAGDELLIRVSDRMRGALRTGDTLARFGGDEFAILIEDGGESAAVGSRIIEAMQLPFTISGNQLSVRMSVGMIELGAEEPSPTMEVLLAHADIAMYSAKRAGKGQLALYEPTMMVPGSLDLPLQKPLADAVAAGAITVVYQPIVSLQRRNIVGLETLPRWYHEGVQIPPEQFLPVALRSGLLSAMTISILEQACADLAQWSDARGHRDLRVAVNVPPTLITDPSFPGQLAAALGRHDVNPDQVVLEMTEDALIGDSSTAKTVTSALSAQGVTLALDDFGKGYSSLVQLQEIPLRILKIDRSFVAEIDHDERAERLIKALIGLGRELGLDVVAEGVDREPQAQVLLRLDCPFAQGDLFASTGSAAEIATTLRARQLVEQRQQSVSR